MGPKEYYWVEKWKVVPRPGGGTYRQRKVDGVEAGSWYEAAEIEARELGITRSEFLTGDHPGKWVDISQITPPISEPDFVLREPPEEVPKQAASAEGSSTVNEKGSVWMMALGVGLLMVAALLYLQYGGLAAGLIGVLCFMAGIGIAVYFAR